jgi:hypothetical protein
LIQQLTFLLVLDPDVKMSYFQQNWDEDLQVAMLKSVEDIVSYLFALDIGF